MICQNCNQNESHYHFTVSNGYQTGDVHLCADCAAKLTSQYRTWMAHAFAAPGGGFQGWTGSVPENGFRLEGDRFPADAGETFKARRQIGQLRAKLKAAVEAEDYETAARLRDQIAGAERGIQAPIES